MEASLAESERTLAANVKLAASGRAEEAKHSNAGLISDLKAQGTHSSKDEPHFTRKIEALNAEQDEMTVAAAAPAPEMMQNYVKASKQRLYQAKSGNRAGYVLQKGDKGIAVEPPLGNKHFASAGALHKALK